MATFPPHETMLVVAVALPMRLYDCMYQACRLTVGGYVPPFFTSSHNFPPLSQLIQVWRTYGSLAVQCKRTQRDLECLRCRVETEGCSVGLEEQH